jgi:hypothetical protein
VVDGGESFIALSTGLQAALWRLGGVPEEHRTDSLSATFNNLAEQTQLTQRYDALCRHHGLRASRCTPGQSQENGSIDSRHDSLKTALDQGLRLRSYSGPKAPAIPIQTRHHFRFDPATDSDRGPPPRWPAGGGRKHRLLTNRGTLPVERQVNAANRPFKRDDRTPGSDPKQL